MKEVSPKKVAEQLRSDIKSGNIVISNVGFESEEEMIEIFRTLAEEYNVLKPLIDEIQNTDTAINETLDRDEMKELYYGEKPLETKGAQVKRKYEKVVVDTPDTWQEQLIENSSYDFLTGIKQFAFYTDWENISS